MSEHNIVFFGSGEFGLPTLEALVSRGHAVRAVVTQPDRPAGRGGKTKPTPVKELALGLGLPVLSPEKPNTPDFIAEFTALRPDLAIVVAYGHLIKKDLLAVPRLGFVNLHASLLPAYRGAAPVPWAILNGETVSGVTVFQLDERFDTGGILGRAELAIAPDDTSASYLRQLAPLGATLMTEMVDGLLAGTATPKAQDPSLSSQAPKFRKEDGAIDWKQPFAVIERMVRAFQPWPLAHTVLATAKGPLRVSILQLERCNPESEPAVPGTVIAADAKIGLLVQTGDGAARLSRLQPEGKRPMSDIEFLRGTKVTL